MSSGGFFVELVFCMYLAVASLADVAQGGHLTLQELETRCLCGQQRQAACAGETVFLEAPVDPVNVFDAKTYPNLPYEKFRLLDGDGRSVEVVFPAGADSGNVFNQLKKRLTMGPVLALVRGRLEIVELPMFGEDGRGWRILPMGPKDVRFEPLGSGGQDFQGD